MVLDDRNEIKNIDSQNVLGSIEALPRQVEHAWDEASKVKVPDEYKDIKNLVMCGMGGSGLGARFIDSVFFEQIPVPLTRVNDYHLPSFVNEHSLVICSTYSGTTEETIQNVHEAIDKNAKWMAIGTGGELLNLAETHGVPFYKIDPLHNPSNQPRMAIGYSVVGQLALVSKAGLVDISYNQVQEAVGVMNEIISKNNPDVHEPDNYAKELARGLLGKILLFFSAEHLIGAAHTVNNQLNENAKNISFDFVIPESNHHLLEGLKHPLGNPETVSSLFFNSTLYSERLMKRFDITKDVLYQNGIPFYEYVSRASSKLSQAFEIIQFGAYVNFYLSMLYEQDPTPIPWVDYLKDQLAK